MSDISLLTGVYANVEAYAVLIDNVIEQIRSHGSDPNDPKQKKLAHLLIDASNQGLETRSHEALIFDSLLRSSTGRSFFDLKALGEHLLEKSVDDVYQKQLETLAKELEGERVEVENRIRRF